MTPFAAKLAWAVGLIAWLVIRHPYMRRARRLAVARRVDGLRGHVLVAIAAAGLFVFPLLFVATGLPRVANYAFQPALAWAGIPVFALSLWLFFRSHRDLGRNFSPQLDIRDKHVLVTEGVYRHVRHPMYLSFLLWGIAQALLLPNWFAGPVGLVSVIVLFAFRIGREEQMMAETFGDAYGRYAERTARLIPGIY